MFKAKGNFKRKMKAELQKIITELKEVIEQTGLAEVYDKEILDCAVKIYLSKKTQETKKENIINKPINRIDEPATEKQKKYLENLGYAGKIEILTKEEAKQLIKEQIEILTKEEAKQLIKEHLNK